MITKSRDSLDECLVLERASENICMSPIVAVAVKSRLACNR